LLPTPHQYFGRLLPTTISVVPRVDTNTVTNTIEGSYVSGLPEITRKREILLEHAN
jgi:hypothetical protein